MPEERRLAHVALTVDGRPLPVDMYAQLTLVTVEESVHLPDAFVIRFADPHFELFDRTMFTFGTKVDIAFSGEGRLTTVTRGEITAISVEQGPQGFHELVLQGMDVTHRLAKAPKTRSFQQQTDSDIVKRIVGDYGFQQDIDSTQEVYDYVLQSNQTDYAFLKERSGRIGFDFWIAEGKFYFKPAPNSATGPPVLKWGENLQKFKVRFSAAERCDEIAIRGWDPTGKRNLLGRATQGDSGTDIAVAKEFSRAAATAFGRVVRTSGRYPVATQREADNIANSLLLRCSGDEVIARGQAEGDPLIAAGAMVQIAQAGNKLSGKYRITSVEHVYGIGTSYLTRFICGGKEPGQLTELFSGNGGGQGSAQGSGSGWAGLVVGVVTNNDDPDKLGRVRVKFPTLSDSDESAWAKVAAPGAGSKRGIDCTPEVNDEVLVGFEHNDVRRPIVLGGLWNSNDQPPDEAAQGGQVMRRSWTSRNGHRMELSDDDSEGAIGLTLGDTSSKLTLKKSASQLTGEEKLTVDGKEIEIKAVTSIKLKAPSIEIEADGAVKISGKPITLN